MVAKDKGSRRMETRSSGNRRVEQNGPASPKRKRKSPNKPKVETNSDNSLEDITESTSEHQKDRESSVPPSRETVSNSEKASNQSDIDLSSISDTHQSSVKNATGNSSENSKKDTHNNENRSKPVNNSRNILVIAIAILVAIVAGIFFPFLSEPQESTAAIVKSKLQIFQEKLKVVQNQFPSQDSRLWKMIRIVLKKHHTTSDNYQPAVLMLASEENAHRTSECLATRLAVLYSHNCTESFGVSGAAIHEMNTLDAKHEIDQQISANFEAGSCAVVVTRFELIPAGATTVFYQYCENDNAPFKDVAVLFTVQVEAGKWSSGIKDFSNLQPKRWENVVVKYLEHSLHSRDPVIMTEDLISGLMSRITPAVIWVKPEDDLPC